MTELFLIKSASVITNLFSGNPFCLFICSLLFRVVFRQGLAL